MKPSTDQDEVLPTSLHWRAIEVLGHAAIAISIVSFLLVSVSTATILLLASAATVTVAFTVRRRKG